MRDLTSGNVLANRFTLKRRLGAGTLTETWLASDRMTRASVALKLLVDPSNRDILKREWQLSLRLIHAHIVRVFEFNDLDDTVFYSQQYIDGPDLSVLAGAAPADFLPAIAAVADALRYAHGRDVVHRDIKASNVLLDGNGVPYLIDFGVAATPADDIGGGSLIASSPQLLDGHAPEPADDVFALGGLIYELATGSSPYSSTNTEDDIRHRQPADVDTLSKGEWPSGLSALVMRMLAKEPSTRPNAAEVVDALRAAGIAAGPVPKRFASEKASPDTSIPPSSIQPRSRSAAATAPPSAPTIPQSDGIRPAVLAGGLAVLVALLLGVVFFLPKAVQTPAASPAAVPVADEPVEESPEPEAAAPATPLSPEDELSRRDERVQARAATEEVLGQLLAKLEVLEERAVPRWGGLPYTRAQAAYEAGDEAYLTRDYAAATARYEEAIALVDPLLEEADRVFDKAMADGEAALAAANPSEAIDSFELAVAMSENSTAARDGLRRAQNLETVLSLIEQGLEFEKTLEMNAARRSFAEAVDLDPEWQPAIDGLARVDATIKQMDFESRMSEGIAALAEGDYLTARAAFRRANEIRPGSPEPADGLLQVDQALRLQSIQELEVLAGRQEQAEQWEEAVSTYEEILELDGTLSFAIDGVSRARDQVALFEQINEYTQDPDSLSSPRKLQEATNVLIGITRMEVIGPRLSAQRDELSRLLKRASTPLTVEIVSDNMTAVSIFKVGRLGSFERRELELRPGRYVAVGSRPGFRDVRIEFSVGPEIEMGPLVVRCEEPI
ncbi:MAG: protein kinase [Woeseiaceae bacterium]|nr:protein kinase [Woeseiaceae bacterium]